MGDAGSLRQGVGCFIRPPLRSPVDISATTKGMTVFATLSYRLWAPEEPAKAPMFHK